MKLWRKVRLDLAPEGYACVDDEWHWAWDPDDDPDKPKGKWVHVPTEDDYYWVGEGEPPIDDGFTHDKVNLGSWKPTEEDERRWKEENEERLKYEIEKMRQEKKDYMKNYHKRKKEELLQPIIMDQSGEKSDYDKLRDDNLKEFEELKKASGLFDD